IRAALKNLPKDLADTYKRVLEGIPEYHKDEAQCILQWILFSFKPVTIEMAQEIFAIDVAENIFHEEDVTFGFENKIENVVGSTLVRVVNKNDSVWAGSTKELQLAHPSVKEFLMQLGRNESGFYINEQLAHDFIGESCLIYVIHYGNDVDKVMNKCSYQFSRYTAMYWFKHIFAGRKNYDISNLLLDQGADVNAQGGDYGNALQAASVNENEGIVKLLLDHGAYVNAQGGFYGNALQAASTNRNEDIVKLLLDQGADVNAQGGHYGNALQAASEEGNNAIVKLLLDQGAHF
ncbi:ankyrin, partial [Dendrothele bispora CBS 962.96]